MSGSPECQEQRPDCPYAGRCYTDVHHLYWPKRDYKTPLERQFRELPINKERICRAIHEQIHFTQPPPEKPSREEMLGVMATEVRRVA